VLTFQERYFGFFDPVREQIRAGRVPIWQLGANYLAYALIDVLSNLYFPEIDGLTDELEELSFGTCDPETLGRLHGVRRSLALLRRIGEPHREAILALQQRNLLSASTLSLKDAIRRYRAWGFEAKARGLEGTRRTY